MPEAAVTSGEPDFFSVSPLGVREAGSVEVYRMGYWRDESRCLRDHPLEFRYDLGRDLAGVQTPTAISGPDEQARRNVLLGARGSPLTCALSSCASVGLLHLDDGEQLPAMRIPAFH